MSRRRPRSRATWTDDDDDDELPHVDESAESAHASKSPSQDDGEEEEELSEERKRERDVWDAFKEEHHEVLEQLPLSLHRQFKLMRELDVHGEAFQTDLLASVRRYIRLREGLARGDVSHVEMAPPNGTNARDGDDGRADDASPSAMQVDATSSHGSDNPPASSTPASLATPEPPHKPGETTRRLLQHIAQTSEEAIRTAEEKVSIAQTAYETVDRHIRLLDQAIKEQEAAISLGVRPGTHLAPILLPDLVVPRWARPARVEHSPVPSLSPEPELYAGEPRVLDLPLLHVPPPKAPKKGKKAALPRPPRADKEEVQPPAVVGGEEPRPRRTGVRLTIPAQSQPMAPNVSADPNETRYCYCNQVSFGTMIACDGESCRLEWFHFGCTGLLEVPSKKSKWYCRECKPKMTLKGRSKG